jgi:N-acetylneuraminic acid mutarotase
MAGTDRRRLVLAGALALAIAVTACSSKGSSPSASPTAAPPPLSAAGQPGSVGHHLLVVASRARWRLPASLSRLVAAPGDGGALLAGGLTPSGASSNRVLHLDPASGQIAALGTVPDAFHDAAAATIAGRLLIFGGGAATSTDTVQSFGEGGSSVGRVVGHLPAPRSDLSAVTIGDRVYILGGYTGVTQLSDVLETTNGKSFATVARLPVTVRYAAVAAIGSTIWVFGGEHDNRAVRDIQRINTVTGSARIVGRLPSPRTEASAMVLAGRVLIAGGRDAAGQALATVDELNRAGSAVHAVARLRVPVADTAVVVAGDTAYLIGGEAAAPMATVQTVTVRSVINAAAEPSVTPSSESS